MCRRPLLTLKSAEFLGELNRANVLNEPKKTSSFFIYAGLSTVGRKSLCLFSRAALPAASRTCEGVKTITTSAAVRGISTISRATYFGCVGADGCINILINPALLDI